jgi:adenine-specific DNA-methyltransferase
MASLYVLYIEDEIVGPCLDLIRKVCEPDSTSRPHVTVRGPLRKKSREEPSWKDETISEVELIEPGQFVSSGQPGRPQNTVFVHCGIEEFARIHQKPDYITSIPHITLYDGNSAAFADKLLTCLQLYRWHLRVRLPNHPTLTRITLQSGKHRTGNRQVQYSRTLQDLFRAITSTQLERRALTCLDTEERLQLVRLIYVYMERSISGEQKETEPPANGLRIELNHTMQALRDLDKIYGYSQLELDLLRDSHKHARDLNPRKLRSLLGQFLTPPELAVEMARFVRPLFPEDCPEIYFGDPSIGSGTFFSALKQVFPRDSIASAFGIEIDKTIASIARTLWGKYKLQLIEGDFFNTELPGKCNLILSNPPYVRHHYIPLEQKERLQQRVYKELGIRASGRSGLYIYFMLLSSRWMNEDAIAAWLVPSEFMSTDYGSALRQYLTEQVSLIRVHRFDPKEIQFEGVIVTSAVIVLRNKKPDVSHRIQLSFWGTLSKPEYIADISIEELRTLKKWPATPSMLGRHKDDNLRLDNLFRIQRGIATGSNSFFILSRNEARKRGIPPSFLRPILPSPRNLSERIIKADPNGYPILDPQLCVIDCSLTEGEIQASYPRMWEYLRTAGPRGVRARYLVRKRNPWYKQEQRCPPPFLCTYLGRDGLDGKPFRFLWNRSEALATNLYLFLYPIGELAALIKKRLINEKTIFELLQQISISDLKDGSRLYGGGLYKLEPSDLGSINANVFKDIIESSR